MASCRRWLAIGGSQSEERKPASRRLKLGAAFSAARQVGRELGLIAPVEHTELVELEVLIVLGVRVHCLLFTKFRFQRSERSPQPRLDRPQWFPCAFGDLALGESFKVGEFHGFALCLRQSL